MAFGIMALDKNKQIEAINYFLTEKKHGDAWRRILLDAPAYAMERIAISMFYSYFKNRLSKEEKEEYRALREEIDATLEREDLEYLIKVMPPRQKEHYQALLSLLPQDNTQKMEQPRFRPKARVQEVPNVQSLQPQGQQGLQQSQQQEVQVAQNPQQQSATQE